MSAKVELCGVTKRFGAFEAVSEVSLEIAAGEFLTLLGPSGCGKTTLLRLIAGFEQPTSGTIWLGGVEVTHLPPYRRPVNQVFQSYALFPHLSVWENVAFGLRMQRVPAAEVTDRVRQALELVSLAGFDARRPQELSGGQKQRVALARALVCRPQVLLLDEPLSALDAKLRQAMQLELKRLQRQVGITFVYVTHDQEEALTMSDRIAIVNRGRIEQFGSPHEIYHRPATAFAADFIGQANLLDTRLIAADGSGARVRLAGGLELVLRAAAWPAGVETALVSIRPEKVHVSKSKSRAQSTFAEGETNMFEARIEEEVFKGATDHLILATVAGTRLSAVVANESALGEIFHAGDRVFCGLHADDLVVLRVN
ncbi:MAG: ABC transporter ATP-binding protein [Verrucomicrobia bacterium]|nr:ABC transporter ATP-binding protein [Verrucomicrobiota bacterium]